jgi:phosphoribosylglycinamide formyltransferase-1
VGKRIVVLISGRGSNLAAILGRQQAGELCGEVVAVLCNRPDAPGLAHAEKHDVPIEVVKRADFPDRASYDANLGDRIASHNPDLVVLAGFMRVLGADVVARFKGQMINTHPSLLPQFPGLDAVGQALEAGVRETGCSVHVVTDEVDAGPIVAQRSVPVLPGDTVETLEARVLAAEHKLLPETIRILCQHGRDSQIPPAANA